jgi:hypothetical protein
MSTFDLENPNPKPGDALRDEAANLLAIKYGHPQREHRTAGKKADLFFTHSNFGKAIKIYVEAKDYKNPLHREEVVKIWSDYSGLIDRNAPAVLLLITKHGLTADAQAFVQDEQADMRHQSIWELENEILGLTEYVRSLVNLFDQDGLSSYYIPGRAVRMIYGAYEERVSDGTDLLLFETIIEWIPNNDYRPLAILGGYGAGKSSFAKRLVSYQAQQALTNPLVRRPILISLGEFARYSSLEGLLGGKFTHDFPIHGFNVHHFLQFSDKGRMLLVLDGFDEMKHAMTWADFRAQISTLNRLTQGKAKVLLLGRPNAFISADEHIHVLRGLKRHGEGWRRLQDWPEFQEYELNPFSVKERSEFVGAYLNFRKKSLSVSQDTAWIDTRIKDVNRLADSNPDIFSKPVHAKIMTDLAADPSVDLAQFNEGVSRWRLYNTFFESLAEREMDKPARRPIGESDRLKFLREVAFWLWTTKGGVTSFSAHDLPDDLVDSMVGGDAPDHDSLKREYLTSAFIEKKSGDIYYFGHRSFAEFLVAQRMVLQTPRGIDHSVYSGLFKDGVELFMREAPDPSLIKQWGRELSDAHGTIHIEYIQFLIDTFGGAEDLIADFQPKSFWIPLLGAFSVNILENQIESGLWNVLRSPDNSVFFLVLKLIQLRYIRDFVPKPKNLHRKFFICVAAVLLDRVFETAKYDSSNNKAAIEGIYDEARSIAVVALPEIVNNFDDRKLILNWASLLQSQKERLQKIHVDLASHILVDFFGSITEQYLPWSEVVSAMPHSTSVKATEYFRRNSNLRAVFTRTKATLTKQSKTSRGGK